MRSIRKALGDVTAVIGAQWGDEGKGKIIDILSENYDIIARAAGGANAGHTIIVSDKKHIFHLLPSGCLHEGKPVVLGSAMVIHFPTLLKEISTLEENGISIIPRMHISGSAHIVLDYHQQIDGIIEKRRTELEDGAVIGTTHRGIGPAYADKAYRTGLRVNDLLKLDMRAIKRIIHHHGAYVHKMFGIEINADMEIRQLEEAQAKLSPCIGDTVDLLHEALRSNRSILIEGAQATLLDIDHGTYPHVTSSSTTAAGALQGLGLPPRALTSCIGVCKSYCTRVGSGPFTTEIGGKRGDDIRERGGEYGSTTGRPRRCGWLSIPDLTFSSRINGFTHLNLTKLDVLDPEDTIPILVRDGTYEELPGWRESTKGLNSFDALPINAQNYIRFIEKAVATPITFIGTGPGREEMIVTKIK